MSTLTNGDDRAPLFARLFDEAERVRWRLTDVDFAQLDRSRVTPGLVEFVRAIACSELTTFSATKRFMQEFADDVDFSQWLAVWFYEETKHPEVLIRWLAFFGATIDERAMLRGRATAPFMKSRMGTLIMNVISEMLASARYLSLSRHVEEPVLAQIGRLLAADEARHATSFYAYARRRLACAERPEVERLDAVKVLHFWINHGDAVQHPVRLLYDRAADDPATAATLAELPFDMEHVHERMCALVGNLVGRPLAARGEVLPVLKELAALAREREPIAKEQP